MIEFGNHRGYWKRNQFYIKWRVNKNVRTAFFDFKLSCADIQVIPEFIKTYTSTSGKIRSASMSVFPYTPENIMRYIQIWDETERNATDMVRSEKTHLDHIVPVSFGINRKVCPKLIGSKENIQLISRSDNLKKSNIITPEAVLLLEKWGVEL